MTDNLYIWAADAFPPFSDVRVKGEINFIHTGGLVRQPPAPLFAEIVDDSEGLVRRWLVWCDIRQLGLPDSMRRAMLRQGRHQPARMLVTAAERAAMAKRGRGPAVPFVEVSFKPRVLEPGLPATIMPAPEHPDLTGHRIAVVDRNYRYQRVEQPGEALMKRALVEGLKQRMGT